jgi:hypothetical protein
VRVGHAGGVRQFGTIQVASGVTDRYQVTPFLGLKMAADTFQGNFQDNVQDNLQDHLQEAAQT